MSISIGPITITPGILVQNILRNSPAIIAIKLTNGTQFDISYTGFGTGGQSVMPAGTESMLKPEDGNSGYINLLAADNLGVGGSGIVNMVVYYTGEDVPKGNWPVTIPAQRVITPAGGGAVVADHLINLGNPASGSPIINIQEAGSTGSQMQADNQGNLVISQYVSSVLTTIFRVIAGQPALASNVLIGDAARQVEILGKLLCDTAAQINATLTVAAPGGGICIDVNVSDGGGVGVFVQPPNTATNFIDFTAVGATPIAGIGFQTTGNLATGFDASLLNLGTVALKWNEGSITSYGDLKIGSVAHPVAIDNNSGAFVTISGSVSGSVTIFMPFQGSAFKYMTLSFNNYQSAANQSMALPVSFSNLTFLGLSDYGVAGNGGIQFLQGATAQNVQVITTIASTGGTGATVTSVYKETMGNLTTVVDHINILASTTPHSGDIAMFGH